MAQPNYCISLLMDRTLWHMLVKNALLSHDGSTARFTRVDVIEQSIPNDTFALALTKCRPIKP